MPIITDKVPPPLKTGISPSPLITLIVAVFNAADTLARCFESIVTQTYSKKEVIVIDGGSSDDTIAVIKKFESNIDYWESRPDRGIYHAWNKALNISHGEWFCFLGADDYLWNENVLTDFLPYLLRAKESNIRVVYGRVVQVKKNGSLVKYLGKSWERIRWQMRHGMPLPHPGLMHHKSLIQDHGLFDESFSISGDYEFLLRELINRPALFANEICSVAHQLGGISQNYNLKAHHEIIEARKKKRTACLYMGLGIGFYPRCLEIRLEKIF